MSQLLEILMRKMDTNAQRVDGNMQGMQNKMDANMQTLSGEMQSMGLGLQASLEEVKDIMAEPRGGTTESSGSAKCVQPEMETGKVRMTSDATIIDGETGTNKHEGTTENFSSETREIEEIEGELYETKDGQTQVEIGGDNGVELVECVGTQCEHRINLPQEQGEMVSSLEADRDQMGPLEPYEVERVSDANGSMQSLGGGGVYRPQDPLN